MRSARLFIGAVENFAGIIAGDLSRLHQNAHSDANLVEVRLSLANEAMSARAPRPGAVARF